MASTVLTDRPLRPALPALRLPRDQGVLALVVAVFAALAAALDPDVFAFQLMGYVHTLFVKLLPCGIALGAIGLLVTFDRADPLGGMRRVGGRIVLRTAPVLGGMVCLMAAFTTFKMAVPALNPFWADAWLADLDEALHGGAPAAALRAAVPGWFASVLTFAYGTPWFAAWLSAPIVVAAQPQSAWRTRYLFAFTGTIICLGTIAATLLSSVGPVFYDQYVGAEGAGHTRFAFLNAGYATVPGLQGVRGYADLLAYSYDTGATRLGTGISAMPSMHCAGAFLNAYLLSSLNRWAGIAGWAFAILILVGSVYTGWHYALDGYVSFVGVTLIWLATGAVFRPSRPSSFGSAASTLDVPHA